MATTKTLPDDPTLLDIFIQAISILWLGNQAPEGISIAKFMTNQFEDRNRIETVKEMTIKRITFEGTLFDVLATSLITMTRTIETIEIIYRGRTIWRIRNEGRPQAHELLV